MTRVLVFGGRDITDQGFVFSSLSRLRAERGWTTPLIIIQGCARGADSLGRLWGTLFADDVVDFPVLEAMKARYGYMEAPKRRNTQMLVEGLPDEAVGFPGHGGTADMARKAIQALGRDKVVLLGPVTAWQ